MDANVTPAEGCTRDEARIAARLDCLGDDDCPCGTSCDLGVCVSACMADRDCATGQRCDDFGRCRDADHRAIVPAPEPVGVAPSVEVEPVATIANGQDDTLVRLVVRNSDSRVRVSGRYGAELECSPGMFTTECELGTVAAGTRVAVRVRRSAATPEGDVPVVHIHSDGGEASVLVLRADQHPRSRLLPPSAGGGPGAQPLAGRYAGNARLDSHGLEPDTRGLPANLDFPITAEIWGEAPGLLTFRIEDPYHVLASDGVVVGTAMLAEAPRELIGPVEVPAQPYASGTLAPADTWSLLAVWGSAEMRTEPGSRQVVIGAHVQLEGTGMRPWLDWNLTLSRSGDGSGAAAPPPETAASVGYSEATRMASPTAWETAVANRFPAFHSLSDAQKIERYQFVFGSRALDACSGLDSTVLGGNRLARRAWLGESQIGGAAWRSTDGLAFRLLDVADEPGTGPDIVDLSITGFVDPARASLSEPVCAGTATVAISDTSADPFTISHRVAFDYCAELAAATGCTVSSVVTTSGGAMGALSISGTVRTAPARAPRPIGAGQTLALLVPTGTPLRTCSLPVGTPTWCAEATSCVEPTPGATRDSVISTTLGTGTLPSGDVRCDSGARTGGIDLDARAAAAGVPTAESVEDCIAELERIRSAPALTSTHGDGLLEAFEASSCIDSVRLLRAMGLGLDAAGESPDNERSTAYGARLLMRWLDLHANIAHEAEQRNALYDLVRSVPGAPSVVDPRAALDASVGAWDLVLQPTFGARFELLEPSVLADPDYRIGMPGVTVRPSDEQANGLPESMMALASRELRLLHSILENEWLEGGAAPPRSSLHSVLPRVLAARAIAAGLAGRAGVTREAFDAVPWGQSYGTADVATLENLRGLVSLLERAATGRNPLGIEDSDLPLYFLDTTTGPGGRFAAVSDFLIGTGPGSTAWVPSLVASTRSAESAARAAWIDEIDRATRAAQATVDHDRWLADVDAYYNNQLRAYCGTTRSGLAQDPTFDALGCALDDAPECLASPEGTFSSWTVDDILGRACVASLYGAAFERPSGDPFIYDERGIPTATRDRRLAPHPPYGVTFQVWASCVVSADDPASARVSLRPCDDGVTTCVYPETWSCPGAAGAIPLTQATVAFLGVLDDDHLARLQDCQSHFPEMRESLPVFESRFEVPGCVHGSIGQAISAVTQTDADLEIARAEAAEHIEAYDIAMRSCFILEEANTRITDANNAHVQTMTGLLRSRAAMEGSAAVAGAAADCMDTLAGVSGTTDANPNPAAAAADGVALALGVGSCVARGVSAGFEAAASGLQADIEVAEVEHDALVANLEAAAETEICFNDARLELVGSRAAALRIQAALASRASAGARLTELLAEVQRFHDEGYDYYNEVLAARVTHPSGEAWANPSIQAFLARFRLARRALYLAVRAVENEFQASLLARQDVLAADSTVDLEDILSTLWTTAGTRSIGGSRPSDLHTVLSLRDDILQLGDESSAPAGLHPLSPTERLRVMLADERYAVRDEAGRLVGLQIPFTLAPLAALGFPTGGVPIYATTDCAERLWSVNASILGTDVWTGSDTTFTRIDLLKQNTFFSQWCGTAPPDAPFQVSSVRPSHNLFVEPGVSGGIDGPFGSGEVTLYSRARMQAFFDVSRAELENPVYANGETSELAARGLYGQYAIFIPAELISRETSSGARSDGLVLDRIDDILLRLDYVSVAR